MRKLLGWLVIIGGIAIGLYIGIWVMFVGRNNSNSKFVRTIKRNGHSNWNIKNSIF